MDTVLIYIAVCLSIIITGALIIALMRRRIRGKPLITERDWLFLFGHTREEVFSSRVLVKFVALLLAIDLIAFAAGYFGVWWGGEYAVGALTVVLVVAIAFITPRWLR